MKQKVTYDLNDVRTVFNHVVSHCIEAGEDVSDEYITMRDAEDGNINYHYQLERFAASHKNVKVNKKSSVKRGGLYYSITYITPFVSDNSIYDELAVTLRPKIMIIRKTLGLTQAMFAPLLGFNSQSDLSRFEKTNEPLSRIKTLAICMLLIEHWDTIPKLKDILADTPFEELRNRIVN